VRMSAETCSPRLRFSSAHRPAIGLRFDFSCNPQVQQNEFLASGWNLTPLAGQIGFTSPAICGLCQQPNGECRRGSPTAHACPSYLREPYWTASEEKMRKDVLMTLVFMAVVMGTAFAAKQTALCPYDGQLAQWTGSQKGPILNRCVSTSTYSSTLRPSNPSNMFSGMPAITNICARLPPTSLA
jgi:hypothetical protein